MLRIVVEVDDVEKAVRAWLEAKLPGLEIEKIEFLDEDVAFAVTAKLAPPKSAVVRTKGGLEHSLEGLDDSYTQLDQTSDTDGGAMAADGGAGEGFDDEEDLPPLDDDDLAKLNVDPDTPEGKQAMREARRELARQRGQRKRDRVVG